MTIEIELAVEFLASPVEPLKCIGEVIGEDVVEEALVLIPTGPRFKEEDAVEAVAELLKEAVVKGCRLEAGVPLILRLLLALKLVLGHVGLVRLLQLFEGGNGSVFAVSGD